MKDLRCAVVGAGIMGSLHLKACTQFPYSKPVAVCDTNEQKLKDVSEKFGIKGYTDYEDMIRNADADVVAAGGDVASSTRSQCGVVCSSSKTQCRCSDSCAVGR